MLIFFPSTWQANNMAVSIIIAAFCSANFVYVKITVFVSYFTYGSMHFSKISAHWKSDKNVCTVFVSYCWRASFGPRAACCRPLVYSDRRNVMLTRPLAQLVGNKANSTRLSGKVKVSLHVCQTYLDSLGWEVLKGFSTHWFSFWNKVIVPSEEVKDLFFISMSPLVLCSR